MKVDEAGRVFQVGLPAQKRGAPEPWERARAFDKKNTNRSVLKSIEKANSLDQRYSVTDISEDPDYTMVLVVGGQTEPYLASGEEYYGVNVLFYPDGTVKASTADSAADWQWKHHRNQIIAAAEKALKRHGIKVGPVGPNTNEGKLTFKQFLEGKSTKIKEPGWYVVDHMDKPVDGPMQERGARELADEMNEKHTAKHGKGDITPYSAEYYTDYDIKRMNEAKGSDAKRLAKQDPEAIIKAKAEIAKARKSGDKTALEKAKKKLAALTEAVLAEGEDQKFNKACKEAAAKLLGVEKVRVVWPDSPAWDKLNDADEGFRDGSEGGDSVTVRVSDVIDDPEELDESGDEIITIIGDGVARGEFNDYGGGDDPHYYVAVGKKRA